MIDNKETEEALEKLKEYKPIAYVKLITKFVARSSVSAIVAGAVHTYVPAESKKQQLQMTVGAWALGGVVSDAAGTWAAEKIGGYYESVEKLVEKLKTSEKTEVETDQPTAE